MKIDRNVDLRPWNTFGMKVKAACFVEYGSIEELEGLLGRSEEFPRPFLHIGRGSNLLFTKDFPGTVFHADIRFISEPIPAHANITASGESAAGRGDRLVTGAAGGEGLDSEAAGAAGREGLAAEAAGGGEDLVEVGTGVIWDDFCKWCAERGLWGPENLSGIPGEVGAAAVQNIGAYGVEVKDFIDSVNCFDTVTSRRAAFKGSECGYRYRESMFKTSAKGRYVVTSVVFRLSAVPLPRLEYGHVRAAVEQAAGGKALTPALIRRTVMGIRDSKLPDPAKIGSAGSFFKNPVVPRSDFERVASIARVEHGSDCQVPHFDTGSGFIKIPAAWLIEQCGLKGFRMANSAVYEHQPLVLVNLTGDASPDEILALEARVRSAVYRKFSITLEPEVEHV